MNTAKILELLPPKARDAVDPYFEAADVIAQVRDPRVLRSLAPSGVRGMLLHRGKQGVPTHVRANHEVHFDWSYPADMPEMRELYTRAKQGQWDSDTWLDWSTDVDPMNPEISLLPDDFMNYDKMAEFGIRLTPEEKREGKAAMAS